MTAGLKGGGADPGSFADSMAEAIEAELNKLLSADGMQPLPGDDSPATRDRRRFIAAIARGVILHLQAHPEAFPVVFTAVPSPLPISAFSAHVEVQTQDVP
jgi:hypothetical protein